MGIKVTLKLHSWNSPYVDGLHRVIQVGSTYLNYSFGLPRALVIWVTTPSSSIETIIGTEKC